MDIKKITVFVILLGLMLSACSKVSSFEDTIDTINPDSFLVNCSDEVNRNKTGDIDAIGYLCDVKINNQTKLKDQEGSPVQFKDFSKGDLIRITLMKPYNISEGKMSLDASEIVRLETTK